MEPKHEQTNSDAANACGATSTNVDGFILRVTKTPPSRRTSRSPKRLYSSQLCFVGANSANHVMYRTHMVFMHVFGLQRDIDMLIFVLYHIWSMIHSDIVIQRTCDASSLCRYFCDNDALKNFWTKSCNKKQRSRKTSARRRVAKDPLQPCRVSVYILNDQITWSESHRRQISWRQKVGFGVGKRNRFLVSWYFQCVIFFCSRGVR